MLQVKLLVWVLYVRIILLVVNCRLIVLKWCLVVRLGNAAVSGLLVVRFSSGYIRLFVVGCGGDYIVVCCHLVRKIKFLVLDRLMCIWLLLVLV